MRTFSLLLLLVLPCCANGDAVRQLAWVKSANYRAEFERQVEEGSFTFHGVSGIGDFVPGLSWDELHMCFAGIAGVENIDGTSDALNSEEHLRLNELAQEYALRLNHLIRAHLIVSGRSPCEPGENWGDLTFLILKYLERFPDSGYGGAMKSPEGFVLGLYLPNKRDEITSEICALIGRLEIRRPITLAISQSTNLRNATTSGKFERVRCEAGRITG